MNPKFVFSGNSQIYYKKTRKELIEAIESVTGFVIANPIFFTLLDKILNEIHNRERYDLLFEDLIEDERQFYENLPFSQFKKLIISFFENSVEIDNDRGLLMESITVKGLKNNFSETYYQYHCHSKIEIQYGKTKFDTAPYDIDVCSCLSIGQNHGVYIEAKRGIEGRDKKAIRKLERIREFTEHLAKITNNYLGYNHTISVFVLTSDNSQKMSFYKSQFPGIVFIGREKFVSNYC